MYSLSNRMLILVKEIGFYSCVRMLQALIFTLIVAMVVIGLIYNVFCNTWITGI